MEDRDGGRSQRGDRHPGSKGECLLVCRWPCFSRLFCPGFQGTTLCLFLTKNFLFPVFDGHAGGRVSAHCSHHLLDCIRFNFWKLQFRSEIFRSPQKKCDITWFDFEVIFVTGLQTSSHAASSKSTASLRRRWRYCTIIKIMGEKTN